MSYYNLHLESKVHPEILWIAVNLIVNPERRVQYSVLVLALVDEAIEIIEKSLLPDRINQD